METNGQRKVRLVREGKLAATEAKRQIAAALASLSIGREFGETIEAYHVRRPDVAARVADYHAAAAALA